MPTESPRPSSPVSLPVHARTFVYGCFLLSGATGLVFQVAWSKMLAVVMGSSLAAITTVVAAYMAGLGLGGLAGGRIADRIVGRLRLYGVLQGSIGFSTPGRPQPEFASQRLRGPAETTNAA